MRPELLRHVNRTRVLDALRSRSPQSRVGLAERLGLTRSTLTVIISALVEQGLVRDAEVDAPRSRTGGRPRVGLELVDDGAFFAGVAIRGEVTTVVVVDLLGVEVARANRAATDQSAHSGETAAVQLLREALATRPGSTERLRGIGVTVAGIVVGGLVMNASDPDRPDVQVGHQLASAFAVPVLVENDANACAISESLAAADSASRDVLFLLLDTGIGAGMLANGQISRGSGGRAGEVGHIRLPMSQDAALLGPGPRVEEMLGIEGVLTSMRARTGASVDLPGYLAALDAGQPDAVVVADEWQHALGWLTATLTLAVAPEAVVFGGPLVAVLRTDRVSFERSLHAHGVNWKLPVGISRYGADATAMGAAALPRASFFSLPMLRPEHGPTSH